MSKNLLIVFVFSVLIDVCRSECPMLMPCSQTHAAALSTLNKVSPNCSALQDFMQCVDSCDSSDRTVQAMSAHAHHACPSLRPPNMAQILQHLAGRFANGTSLHLTAGDMQLLHNCSAVESCVPQNVISFHGADTCKAVRSLFKCIHAALLSCTIPKSMQAFIASQKQEMDKLCNSDNGISAMLPSFLGDGLSALSSPGCVELMRCTGDGQSLSPELQDMDTFCLNIKIVNKCIDESKDSCAVSDQFRLFIDRYRHEENEHCHSGVGVQSINLSLVFFTATVSMVTRHLQ